MVATYSNDRETLWGDESSSKSLTKIEKVLKMVPSMIAIERKTRKGKIESKNVRKNAEI